ncbi:MAG: family transposase [Citricoccus sp.]|nr:family transposase [Citricoccus sp. WCRC_4]
MGSRHRHAVRDAAGRVETAEVELTYATVHVLPPIGKGKRYPALDLTILHAREPDPPDTRPRIDWKLATDLPVADTAAAVEKLHWYSMRWRIEEFHKILKSGCKVEAARLRTAERLVKLIAVLCIVGWRVFWLRMMNRVVLDAEPGVALTGLETALLDRLVPDRRPNPFGHPGPGLLRPEGRPSRRLARPRRGPAARRRRPVARHGAPDRYRSRRDPRPWRCG